MFGIKKLPFELFYKYYGKIFMFGTKKMPFGLKKNIM